MALAQLRSQPLINGLDKIVLVEVFSGIGGGRRAFALAALHVPCYIALDTSRSAAAVGGDGGFRRRNKQDNAAGVSFALKVTEELGAGTPGCAVRHGMARTARRSKQDNAAGVSFALKFHRGARCRNSGLCCPPWKQARAV